MVAYKEIYEDVKNILSEYRFKHSERVVKRAIEYAEVYNVDIEKVKLTAIAHDIAKEIPKEEILLTAEKMGIELDDVEKVNLGLPHAKIGAKICETKYGFTKEMCEAIRYHSTGKENMTMLEKIIYLADGTEEERQYCSRYAELAKADIDKAMEEVTNFTIRKILETNGIVHLDSVKCYNYYNMKNKGKYIWK